MPMTQQQLSQARCTNPGCDHKNHETLFIHSRCHPEAGLMISYHLTTGVLGVGCNECGGFICEVLVAPSEVQ